MTTAPLAGQSTGLPLPATLAVLPAFGAEHFGDRPAQRFLADGTWYDRTFAEVDVIAREIGLGLVDLGVAPGDRVCVLADTRPESMPAELGIARAGAVVVPIYPSSSADECAWALGNSGAVVVICENAQQAAKVAQVRDDLPDLRES